MAPAEVQPVVGLSTPLVGFFLTLLRRIEIQDPFCGLSLCSVRLCGLEDDLGCNLLGWKLSQVAFCNVS